MGRISAEILVPNEIKQLYSILLGFWASYILGNIIYFANTPPDIKGVLLLGTTFFIYLGVLVSTYWESKGDYAKSISDKLKMTIYYSLAIFCWFIVCCILFIGSLKLPYPYEGEKVFLPHIWFGVFLYLLKLISIKFI